MVSMIVIVDRGNGIAYDGKQLIFIEDDLRHFKKITLNKNVVMGRKTFESLPFGALPNRTNIVLTKNTEYKCNNCLVYHSKDDIFKNFKDIIVIGGEQIYKEFLQHTDIIYMTLVHKYFEKVDTYFPKISDCKFEEVKNSGLLHDKEQDVYYRFIKLERK
jgi:dihydrofolate reductase